MREGGERARCAACGGEHATSACDQPSRDHRSTIQLDAPGPPPPAADPLVGAMVGSFRVQKLLGRGGMGTVYLAEHPVIGSKVAIKFLHESMCASPEAVRRFYDEARSVNLIGHENIVAIFDLAQLPPARYYIVMEYLDGTPLSALLRAGPVPPPTTFDVLLQLTGALQAAHEHGVVHRDLKPENVFLTQRGGRAFVKLVDFGIAKLADRGSGARTAAGVIVGTPEYMAPEQCEDRAVDRRTDVYALGVMAYELATGRLPFTGTSIPQLLLAQLRTPPPPPREVAPSVSAALEAAILKALAKDPDDRFQDMRAFAEALEAARAPAASGAGRPAPSAGAPRSAPEAAPPHPAAREVEVAVVGADGRPRTLSAREATRGGIFLSAAAPLPPLRSTVRLALSGDGGRRVEVPAEVVRHVSATDAARWNMPEGFAVALAQLSHDQRAAVDRLAAQLADAPAPTPAPALSPVSFDELERRAARGPYETLGAPPAAGFPEIRERARAVRQLVDALRPVLPPEAQASRVPALLARVQAAVAQLGSPGERLVVDVRLGNFEGVAHCVTAGVPAAVLSSRRQAFLAANPRRAQDAQRHLARARVAAKLGNRDAARAEYAAALRADPLDLAVHQAYWDLERRR